MSGLNDILKSTQWMRDLYKPIGLNSQIAEMLRTQERISKSVTAFSSMTDIAKMMNNQIVLSNPSIVAMERITKSMQFAIPHTAIDTMISITQRYTAIFDSVRAITEALSVKSPIMTQVNNLHFALEGISSSVVNVAARKENWDLINDFEDITEEAISLNERIFNVNGVTKHGLNELKDFLNRIEIKVDGINSDANSLFWKLLAIIGFILAVVSEVRVWLPHPEYATKQEVKTIINERFTIYEKKLKQDREFRVVRRISKVMSKPRIKSLEIERLPVDIEVMVLQVKNKWVYVSYVSPIDNLPQTGWILKKYLDKP
jgi:hypothetical protein